jgi:hypothetical protein
MAKPAITCFKYQVYLYGSEAFTFECYTLSSYRASIMSTQITPLTHPLQTALPPSMAAGPSPIWKRTQV